MQLNSVYYSILVIKFDFLLLWVRFFPLGHCFIQNNNYIDPANWERKWYERCEECVRMRQPYISLYSTLALHMNCPANTRPHNTTISISVKCIWVFWSNALRSKWFFQYVIYPSNRYFKCISQTSTFLRIPSYFGLLKRNRRPAFQLHFFAKSWNQTGVTISTHWCIYSVVVKTCM